MLKDVLDKLPAFQNDEIIKSFIKGYSIINRSQYSRPVCSISGGSDSDIMLDIVYRIDEQKKVKYVWFDTGLEYKATREHLKYIENKYGIIVERERAVKPIPICCKEYGQPFLSKLISEQIGRLQLHGFRWQDRPYEELKKEYPKCNSAIKWWCNEYQRESGNPTPTRFDIGRRRLLKEFLIANPPWFKISSQCCHYAKKEVSRKFNEKVDCDLKIIGVRKAEGGVRAISYKNCYSTDTEKIDEYRPIFWFKDADKREYEQAFGITHSACYSEYGLLRTGCVGCPYGKNMFDELEAARVHEPAMYKAICNVFSDSYEYTKQFMKFKEAFK